MDSLDEAGTQALLQAINSKAAKGGRLAIVQSPNLEYLVAMLKLLTVYVAAMSSRGTTPERNNRRANRQDMNRRKRL